ncbi:SRPBCC family protein [Vitiosangium sp. GDMCC 1.1324]|uniref:SRPBCC family protein n=1 Tax=Vitiosangium sp. (strain GDMCC 1.1324) TaxID=2138576 RepID=UPI000D35FFF7|nr:SRPBCC family protein [Vitiosangium sp. GDMCC 1.1324]PTL85995.1 polyketide cyclase [Vitiosangium sp. GDMCC 1.1324]
MLKKILIGVAVVLVALLGIIAMRPSAFTVQRTATFKASPDIAFGYVNDFHLWSQWSPWDKLDPNQKRTFEGPPTGPGSIYSWSGNDQVGEGRMTIEESNANEVIRIKLEFLKPWQATNTTTFTFTPTADGVSVNWKMEGHNDFMGKAFSLFADMDSMVGKDFENGLANMQKVVEAETQKRTEAEAARQKEAEKAAAAPAEGQQAPTGGQNVAAPTP